jgi:hypothetical protein
MTKLACKPPCFSVPELGTSDRERALRQGFQNGKCPVPARQQISLSRRMTKLEKAKARANAWASQERDAKRDAAICSYFGSATPSQIIAMWQTGKTIQGRVLSRSKRRRWRRLGAECSGSCRLI